MANYAIDDEDRRDDELDGSSPSEDGSPLEFADEVAGPAGDELADRAQAEGDRAHAIDNADVDPADASMAAHTAFERPGPDADERPA